MEARHRDAECLHGCEWVSKVHREMFVWHSTKLHHYVIHCNLDFLPYYILCIFKNLQSASWTIWKFLTEACVTRPWKLRTYDCVSEREDECASCELLVCRETFIPDRTLVVQRDNVAHVLSLVSLDQSILVDHRPELLLNKWLPLLFPFRCFSLSSERAFRIVDSRNENCHLARPFEAQHICILKTLDVDEYDWLEMSDKHRRRQPIPAEHSADLCFSSDSAHCRRPWIAFPMHST